MPMLRVPFITSRGRAGPSCKPRKARGGSRISKERYGDDEQRRVALQIGPAQRAARGCGGRRPSPASLLLDVPVPLVRRRRRSWDLAAWRSQRGSREVMKGTLSSSEQGLTLTEVLVATALAVIVVVGISITDVTRVRIEQDLRSQAGPRIAQIAPALAITHIAKQMAQADRIVLLSSGILGENPTPAGPAGQGRMRIRRVGVGCSEPIAPSCFSDPTKFRWDEYRLTGTDLEYVDVSNNVCGAKQVLAGSMASLTFRFRDSGAAFADPSQEPFGAADPRDNNVVEYTLTWSEGALEHTFVGQMTGRLIPYSDLGAILDATSGDSGLGLASAGVSDPPTVVCP